MKNKKAELHPIMIIVIIVAAGLIIFFGIRTLTHKTPVVSNVTHLNDSPVSTGIQVIKANGAGTDVINGTNLTLVKPIENVSTNDTSKILIKVYYPNNTLTPGAIMSSNVTEICTSGYSANVRNVSQATKDAVFIEYKLSPDQPTGTFEVDHLIPLELGGSNEITNLWPEPATPKPGFHEKDVLENYYHAQVCAGKMDLRQAQSTMALNWFQGYVDAVEHGGIKVK